MNLLNLRLFNLGYIVRDIKKYAIVIPYEYTCQNIGGDDFRAGTIRKEDYEDIKFMNLFNFNFNKERGYFIEYILIALRIMDENDAFLFLLNLFIKEVHAAQNQSMLDIIADSCEWISDYIENRYNIKYRGSYRYCSGLFCFSEIRKIKMDDKDKRYGFLIKLCSLYWKEFFLENIIVEKIDYEINPTSKRLVLEGKMKCKSLDDIKDISIKSNYYDSDWPGYIIINGEKVIYDKTEFIAKYKAISIIILEQKYEKEIIEKGKIVYLDRNPLNIDHSNIALFKSDNDAIRYCEGGATYNQTNDGICYCSNEIGKKELGNLYSKYSYEKLTKIYGLSTYFIKKKINDFQLPNRSLL